jgi:hypothetical protein
MIEQKTSISVEQISSWFENLVEHLQVDKVAMELGIADPQKSALYENAISGNQNALLKSLRNQANEYFIERIVKSFIAEISQRKALPLKLAFSLSPSTILAWVEIKENDEKTEDQILLAEAKVNSIARDYNFSIDTMIVEDSDKLPLPPHYIEVKFKNKPAS